MGGNSEEDPKRERTQVTRPGTSTLMKLRQKNHKEREKETGAHSPWCEPLMSKVELYRPHEQPPDAPDTACVPQGRASDQRPAL
jgi:hypothetical protein